MDEAASNVTLEAKSPRGCHQGLVAGALGDHQLHRAPARTLRMAVTKGGGVLWNTRGEHT